MTTLSQQSMISILKDKNRVRRKSNIAYLKNLTTCIINQWDSVVLHIDNEDPNFIIKYPLGVDSTSFEGTRIMDTLDAMSRRPVKTEVFLNRSNYLIFSFSIIFTFSSTENLELSYTIGRRHRKYEIKCQIDHGENNRGEMETIIARIEDPELFMRKIIIESNTSLKLQKIIQNIQRDEFTPSWKNVKDVANLLRDIDELVDICIVQDPSSTMEDYLLKTGRLPEEMYMRLA